DTRRLADAMANATRQRQFDVATRAALQMVEALCASGEIVRFRALQMRAMILEDGFNNASVFDDLASMAAIRDATERLFKQSGHLTVGNSALVMKARECCIKAGFTGHFGQRTAAYREGLEAARWATYYAMRTGRSDTMKRAIWHYAAVLE